MKRLLIIFSLWLPISLTAQHQLGWRTDQYAGINAALLNPANTAQTPYSWDLNIGEASFFLSNNYAFLENTSVSSLLKQLNNENNTYFLRDDLPADFKLAANEFVYDFNAANNYYLQQHNSVLGPSLSVRIAPMTRIGVFSRAQTMVSLKNLDSDVGFDEWYTIEDGEAFAVDAFSMALSAWSELGFNVSQGFELNNGDLFVGVNIRRLSGQRGAYFISKNDFDLSKIPPNTLGLEGLGFDLEVGFSNNILSEELAWNNDGNGWGFDLGFSYLIDYVDGYYRWEFGAAILDIGQILFKDAQLHQFNSGVLHQVINSNYDNLTIDDNLEPVAQQLSQDIFNDPQASLQGNEIVIRLPTTLQFQASYQVNDWVKVNGNVLAAITTSAKGGLSRMTTIGVTPRMDRHWWSLALPVSFYAGEQLRMGLAARLGPLFIGTDNIGSFFNQNQFSGTDIYAGVKFFPLGLGLNKGNKRGRGKEVKCYDF